MNNRGLSTKTLLILLVGLGILIAFWVFGTIGSFAGKKIDKSSQSFETVNPSLKWMNYVFGEIPSSVSAQVESKISIVIIMICAWVLLFVTFGDIIDSFSTFDEKISWVVALAMSLIAANFKLNVWLLSGAIGLLSFMGGLAVIFGIGLAFFGFIMANLGLLDLRNKMKEIKAMNRARRGAQKVEEGASVMAKVGEITELSGKDDRYKGGTDITQL